MVAVAILGDSVFDNATYVDSGAAVHDHLRRCLPPGWSSALLAVDGSVTEDVYVQLEVVPAETVHLMISCGGNDALGQLGLMQQVVPTVGEAMRHLAAMRDSFGQRYRRLLERACATGMHISVCTIYDTTPSIHHHVLAVLSLYNDIIIREAARAGAAILDLRVICNLPEDYSGVSPIEPSAAGGRKIAAGIVDMLVTHEYREDRSSVYPGKAAVASINRGTHPNG